MKTTNTGSTTHQGNQKRVSNYLKDFGKIDTKTQSEKSDGQRVKQGNVWILV